MGLLYGGNTGGAVFGCLLAGFYLLRVHRHGDRDLRRRRDERRGRTLACSSPRPPRGLRPSQRGRRSPPPRSRAYWPVYVAIALSGATALGAEVIWTRLLSLMLGADGLHVLDHPASS